MAGDSNTYDIRRIVSGTGGSGPGGDITVIINTSTFIFEQGVPALVWDINHSLCKFPSVTVVDSAETVVTGQVEYINNENIRITFNTAFSGKAYLN
jgi:hypothetical protein